MTPVITRVNTGPLPRPSLPRRPTTSNLESLQKGLDEDEEQIEEPPAAVAVKPSQVAMVQRPLMLPSGWSKQPDKARNFSAPAVPFPQPRHLLAASPPEVPLPWMSGEVDLCVNQAMPGKTLRTPAMPGTWGRSNPPLASLADRSAARQLRRTSRSFCVNFRDPDSLKRMAESLRTCPALEDFLRSWTSCRRCPRLGRRVTMTAFVLKRCWPTAPSVAFANSRWSPSGRRSTTPS